MVSTFTLWGSRSSASRAQEPEPQGQLFLFDDTDQLALLKERLRRSRQRQATSSAPISQRSPTGRTTHPAWPGHAYRPRA